MPLERCPPAKPYPNEFQDDIVRVASTREPSRQLKKIAAYIFHQSDVEDGLKPGNTATENGTG